MKLKSDRFLERKEKKNKKTQYDINKKRKKCDLIYKYNSLV